MKSRMIRLVSWLLVIAMLAAMPVAAMAEEATVRHYHACYEEGKGEMVLVPEKSKKATCTEDGYDVYRCTACGYEEKINIVPKGHTFSVDLAHDVAEQYYHPAQGTEAGYWLIPCSVQGCTATMRVTDHDPRYEQTPLTDKDGNPVYETNEKGEQIKDENGNPIQKTYMKHVSNYNEGHSLGEAEDKYWASTCVSSGYKAQRCTVDGCDFHTPIAVFENPHGHDWITDEADGESGNPWKTVKEATGTTQGLQQRTCRICGVVDTRPIAYLKPDENNPETVFNSATVINDKANLYGQADASSEVVAAVLRGSRFYIHAKSEDGKWCQIGERSTVYGWVLASDLQENAAPGSVPASTYAGATQFATVTSASGLKVRAGASSRSSIVSTLGHGTPVYIYATSGDYYRISLTEERWVHKDEGLFFQMRVQLGLKDVQGTDAYWYDVNDPNYNKKETMEDPSGSVTDGADVVIAKGTVSSFTPLNVRKEAKISVLNVIGSLARGTSMEIYEKTTVNGHEWGKIKYKDGFGWVCLDYVTITSTTDTETVVADAPNATVVNVANSVRVRKEPDPTNPMNILGELRLGTRVTITKYEIVDGKNWYYADKKGWIFQDYLKLDAGVLDSLKGGGAGDTPLARYTNVSVPVVVVSRTALKASASDSSATLMMVSADSDVVLTVTDRTRNGNTVWCQVAIGGVTGWISSDSLRFLELTATVNGSNVKAYYDTNVDSGIRKTLTNGAQIIIEENSQYLDTAGTYVWARFRDDTYDLKGYVQMHNLSNIARADMKEVKFVSVSIPAKVSKDGADVYGANGEYINTSDVLLTLNSGREITISGLANAYRYGKDVAFGRVTIGSYTGWIELGTTDDYTGTFTMGKVTQNPIKGVVSEDSVNLYKIPYHYSSSTNLNVERVLRKGQKLTVLCRVSEDSNIWGMVRIDSKNYWCNLNGVTLEGQTVAPQTPSTPTTPDAPTTPTTPPVSTSAAGTIVCSKTVNVRKAAGVANPLVTTLPNGTKVTVYEQTTVDNAVWGRIDQGWVALEYVDLSTKPNAGTGTGITGGNVTNTILTTVPSGSVAVGFVNTADLAVRSGAGQGYAKVTTLKKGANVVIHEQQLKDGMIWGRTDQGWICTSYVTLTGIGNSGNGSAGIIKGCFYTANVRSAPGVGNALVGKVMVNSPVVIYEQKEYSNEMWGRTDIGWVSMEYVLIGSIPGI